MDKCTKTAALYIASLKALALIHQGSHWITKGSDFYGDHLLFERIYKSVLEDLDATAEKCVGVFGEECLSYELQNTLLAKILAKYNKLSESPMEQSLAIERDVIKLTSDVRKCFEDEERLTLGLDDLLAGISNNREGAVYLLQQALKS